MPKLDFLVIADHVRPESGVFNILAAGVDRVATEVPGLVNMGLAGRIVFTGDEVVRPHIVDIRIAGPGGTLLFQLRGEMMAGRSPDGLPEDWPLHGGIAVNMAVPIQEHGVHTLTLLVDDEEFKTIRILVEPLQEA